ncbi:MAG: hypothetical protein LBP83_09465 [Dysgonamonadaceae bacterium]|jgi:hypothetical protein|nr:hypothetical protein [Dysgonamonadaceae bacterium]
MKTNKILIFSLLIANVFALCYLLFLGYHNSLLLDDYGFITSIKERGYAFIKDMYYNWQGRFGFLAISCTVYKTAILLDNLLPITILQLLIGYGCFYLLIQHVFNRLNKGFILLISVTAVHLGILGLLEFCTFYWICTSPYIILIFITALLIYAVFNTKLNIYIAIPLILFSSFIVGGGLETYTPIVILSLGIVFLYRLLQNGWKSIFSQRLDRQLVAVLLLLSVFFLFQIIAPGNKVRMSVDSQVQATGLTLILKTGSALIKFLFAVGSKLLYFIAAFPLFYWIGYCLQQKKVVISCKYASKKYFIISCFLLLLFLYTGLLPQIYVYAGYLIPSLRPYSYTSFVMVAFFGYWGVLSGYRQHHKKVLFTTVLVSCLCIIGVSSWRMHRDFRSAAAYHEAIENRFEQIQKLKKEGYEGIAYIEPVRIENEQLSLYSRSWNFVRKIFDRKQDEDGLLQSGFPYEKFSLSAENPGDWRNQFLKKYFDVQFDILSVE